MTPDYREKLEAGARFEDYVSDWLYEKGLILIGYKSAHYQIHAGENRLGLEIKNDRVFRKPHSAGLYFETAEKSDPRNKHYVASGIYRSDNAWLYAIGDEATLWVFAISHLQALHERKDERGEWVYPHKRTPTSRGYILPLEDANRYALLRLDRKPGSVTHIGVEE